MSLCYYYENHLAFLNFSKNLIFKRKISVKKFKVILNGFFDL